MDAYKILKEKYSIPHSLVLAGNPGYNYETIKLKIKKYLKIKNSELKIIESGYVDENQKQQLLKNADVFLFPSLYEGFGLPILEAQNASVPVVASNVSSIPEVVNGSALLSNPENAKEIASMVYKIISDEKIKKDLIQKGLENLKRFDWSKCAEEIAELILAKV